MSLFIFSGNLQAVVMATLPPKECPMRESLSVVSKNHLKGPHVRSTFAVDHFSIQGLFRIQRGLLRLSESAAKVLLLAFSTVSFQPQLSEEEEQFLPNPLQFSRQFALLRSCFKVSPYFYLTLNLYCMRLFFSQSIMIHTIVDTI